MSLWTPEPCWFTHINMWSAWEAGRKRERKCIESKRQASVGWFLGVQTVYFQCLNIFFSFSFWWCIDKVGWRYRFFKRQFWNYLQKCFKLLWRHLAELWSTNHSESKLHIGQKILKFPLNTFATLTPPIGPLMNHQTLLNFLQKPIKFINFFKNHQNHLNLLQNVSMP